jgi:predicted nucleotidyltransferase
VEFSKMMIDNVGFGNVEVDIVGFGNVEVNNVEFGNVEVDIVEFGNVEVDEKRLIFIIYLQFLSAAILFEKQDRNFPSVQFQTL